MTPSDCDLRGMPYMELDIVRLLDSDFFAMSTGDEFKAGVALWGKSWNQVPAASLPTDDRVLGHLAGVGRKDWPKVKEMALHGWIECDDGRLYHPTVAEKALKAWGERQAYREDKSSEAERKAKERQDRADMFSALRAAGAVLAWNTKTSTLREEIAKRELTVAWTNGAKVTEQVDDASQQERDLSRDTSQPDTRTVTAKRGNGRGNGTLEEEESFALVAARAPTPSDRLPDGLVQQAFDDWNAMAARSASPKAISLTDDRRRKIGAKLKEVGIEGWRAALDRVAASPHCQGENDRGWKADLDFLFQAKSWNRLMEGTYDARPAANQNQRSGGWDPMQQAIDGIDFSKDFAA